MHSSAHQIEITLLGTGTSHGIPMINCRCEVCTSTDPHDKRMRTAAHVAVAGKSILIDTPPELRLQCLANDVTTCDAVLYTHHHADHVTGLDDLRSFSFRRDDPLPVYGMRETLDTLAHMFPYAVGTIDDYPSVKPNLAMQVIDGPFDCCGVTVTPIPLLHGRMPVLGFRLGRFAYCTDVSRIPDESWGLLEGLDVLVLDGLRQSPHPTHFNLEQAVVAAKRIAAGKTVLTHIAHELSHSATNAALPANIQLGFDGQRVVARL